MKTERLNNPAFIAVEAILLESIILESITLAGVY
jgi:hypothetical protein